MTVDAAPEIEVLSMEDLVPYEDNDDPNRRAHIVNPPDNPHISHGYPAMTGQDVVISARLGNLEVTALCGYKFVPKHNPDKLEACEACMKIAEQIMSGLGE